MYYIFYVLYQFAYFKPQIKILNSSIVDKKKKKQQIRNNKKWTDTELHYMATVIYYKQSAFKER